jgi:electron transfer flavoprotein alpha/beta subunit
MPFLELQKQQLMMKLKKPIKKWLLSTIPIEIEINLKFNNNKLPINSETLMRLKMYSPTQRREKCMIPEE